MNKEAGLVTRPGAAQPKKCSISDGGGGGFFFFSFALRRQVLGSVQPPIQRALGFSPWNKATWA